MDHRSLIGTSQAIPKSGTAQTQRDGLLRVSVHHHRKLDSFLPAAQLQNYLCALNACAMIEFCQSFIRSGQEGTHGTESLSRADSVCRGFWRNRTLGLSESDSGGTHGRAHALVPTAGKS